MPVFYPGNIISSSEPSPGSGIWSMTTHMQKRRAGTWPATTPEVVRDSEFEYTTLLLKAIGANTAQNATFLDSSASNLTVTRNGDTTQGAFSPFGIDDGKWSVYFDGTGDSITTSTSAELTIGSGNYTIEFWMYALSFSSGPYLYSTTIGSSPWDPRYAIYVATNGVLGIFTTGSETATSATLSLNTWYHIAVSRASGTTKVFVNGTQVYNAAKPNDNITTNQRLELGAAAFNGSNYFNGYISNLRVVKGTAVYTSAFTPTTSSLTAISGTSLLTCQSNRFKDNSTNNFTLTRNGDTKVSAFTPFNQSGSYTSSTNGGSSYFDGTGDYLTAGSSVSLTGDFTIECWVYGSSLSKEYFLYCLGNDYNSTGATFFIATTGYPRVYTNNSHLLSGTSTAIRLGQWNHVAFVRSSNVLRAYINGVLADTSATWSVSLSGLSHINAELNGVPGTTYVGGACYISNLRVNTTAVYTSAFTPPISPVSAISGTSLLMNGTNAGIVDASRKRVIYTDAQARVSTNVVKYDKSISFNATTGTALYILNSEDLYFKNADFTIELWLRLNSFDDGRVITTKGWGSINAPFLLYTDTVNNKISFYASSSGSSWDIANALAIVSAPSINTWYHLAVTRSGSTFRTFVNGTQTATTTSSASLFDAASYPMTVGGSNSSTNLLNGYIEDLRFTRGVARYTGAFTPPTTSLPTA